MAVTAYRKAGSGKTLTGYFGSATNWTNPGNVTSDNNTDATNAMGTGSVANPLLGYNFGFTTADVPTGSTINGIEFRVEAWRSSGAGTATIGELLLLKDADAGTPATYDEFGYAGQNVTGTRTVYTYGGATTLGSIAPWTVGEITAAGFGVGLAGSRSGTATLAFDYIEARVHYTPGTTDGVGSASGSGTPTATGRALKPAAGSASGTGAASGVGHEIHSGAGSAPGTSTVAATANPIGAGVGAAAGAATQLGSGAETIASEGHSDGVGTASGVGTSTAGAAGSATAQGTPTAVGTAITPAVGSASGSADANAGAEATVAAVGSGEGTSDATGVAPSIVEADGSASGESTASATGSSNEPTGAGQRDGDIGWERPGRRFHHVPGRSALEEASLTAVSRTLDKIERRLAKAEETPVAEAFGEVVETFEAVRALHPLFDDGALAEFHAALDRIAQTVAKPMFEAPQIIDEVRNALDLARAYRAIIEDEEDATLALLMAA